MSCLVALHNASKQFLLPLLANMPAYLGMALLAGFWGPTAGVVSIPLGMLAGYGIAVALLFRALPGKVRFDTRVDEWSEVGAALAQMPLVLVSMLCFTMFGTVDAVWASRLGQAQLSALGYGQRLIVSIGNIVAIGPATILLPYLAEAVAANRNALANYGERVTRIVFAAASPLAMAVVVLRVPLVEVLFERGAFTHGAVLEVSSVVPGMFTGMVPMLCTVMLFKAFYAQNRAVLAARMSLVGVVVYFVSSGMLSHAFGLQGIVSAYALTWSVLAIACLWHLSGSSARRVVSPENRLFSARVICALCAEWVVMRLAAAHVGVREQVGWAVLVISACVVGFSGLVVYAAAAYLLGIREVTSLLAPLARSAGWVGRTPPLAKESL